MFDGVFEAVLSSLSALLENEWNEDSRMEEKRGKRRDFEFASSHTSSNAHLSPPSTPLLFALQWK